MKPSIVGGVIAVITLFANPTSAYTPSVEPQEPPHEEIRLTSTWRYELTQYPVLEALAGCESGFNEKAVNPMDSDGLPAYGLFQYKETTWDAFQKEMGVSGLDIMSGADQLAVTRWAFNHNKQSHWGICL